MSLSSWILAARPKTLWVGISPVLLGMAWTFHTQSFHFTSSLAALFGAIFIQIGTNFANDYFDFKKGADTSERLGPKRATAEGLVTPQAMKKAFIFMFIIAGLISIYLIFRGGLPILGIAVFSILFGVLYTGGPYPLAYIGVADLFAFLFFGPVAVAGTIYVQTLSFSMEGVLLGIPQGLFSMAVLCTNNLRDIDQDRKANKKTLAVRFGPTFARLQYTLSVIIGCLLPLSFSFLPQRLYVYSIPVLMLFIAAPLLKSIWTRQGADLNAVLAKTSKLQFVQAVTLSLGLFLQG